MTVTTAQATAPFGAITTLRLVNVAETAMAAFASWNKQRQTKIALSSLSDAMLADIGLNRDDLRNIPV